MNILFLCTGNACRSQMAEGWARHLGGDRVCARSAGIETHGLNPRAVEVMRETGVDISGQPSERVTGDMLAATDVLVTVCGHADEHCPVVPPGVRREHWPLADPARATGTEAEILAVFRDSRDDIRGRVADLLERLAQERGAQSDADEKPAMGLFERYLTVWVGLCIVAGIGLGQWFPAAFRAAARIEVAHINLPVAALVWLMIIPMLLRIDLHALTGVRRHWRGVAVTLFVNWGVKPFSMALLGWLFIGTLFRDYLPAAQIESYIAGLVILAAAPCTAMVFVWSHLMRGEPHYTLSQVALNDVIMVFAFAPIVGLLLGLSAITVPWDTLLLSVLLYIVVPLVIAGAWRGRLLREANGAARLERVIARVQPFSLLALLATLVLLFGFQGPQIIAAPLIIALLAVPILIQVLCNAALAYGLNRLVRSPHCIAGPSALIGASNFFELAVATAIALFGFESGAALATVVGVLIEVPVMLLAVGIVNRSRRWYERRPGIASYETCCPTGERAPVQG